MPLTLFGYDIGTNGFSSSKNSRYALRGNLVSQTIGTTFDAYTGIPAKLVQMLTSGYAGLCHQTHNYERIIHGILMLNAAAEFALFTAQLFMNETCEDDSTICTASIYLQLTYSGLLSAVEFFSEASKDKIPEPAPAPAAAV